jgi:hypothetical protein
MSSTKNSLWELVFFARKEGRKALADIAAAKTMIKTHTFPRLDNKQHTHTHTTQKRHIHTYTQEDNRR